MHLTAEPPRCPDNFYFFGDLYFSFLFFKTLFIYLFMTDTEREREAETQAEGEAGSMQEA